MPAKKAGGSRQLRTSSAGHHPRNSSTSHPYRITSLTPEGWAPGPAGDGIPYKLPPLVITLPESFTAPLAHQHYEVVRDQLRQRVRTGGHDALTVIINARMQTLAHGKARPNIILVHFYCILAVSY